MANNSGSCDRCIHGSKSSGLIVPVQQRCLRVSTIGDEVVAEVLEPMLRLAAAENRCPHFRTGEDLPDSYRAQDL